MDDQERLENDALAVVVAERIASASGKTMSGVEFIRSLGFDEVADEVELARGSRGV